MSIDVAQPHRCEPPLGELLLARGRISQHQLDQALSVQAETRRPLGQVLVELGFATGPTIAQALATQHGRIFKSEHGFATEFDAALEAPQVELPPVTVRSGNKLTLVPAPVDPGTPAPIEQTDRTEFDAEWKAPPAPLEPETALTDAEERLADLADQLAAAAARIVAAELARDTAGAEAAEKTAELVNLAAERDSLTIQLEQERDHAQRQLTEARQQLVAAIAERDAARETASELEQALTDSACLSEQGDALAEEAAAARRELEHALAESKQAIAALEADRARLNGQIQARAREADSPAPPDPEHDAAVQQLAAAKRHLGAAIAERDTARTTASKFEQAFIEATTTLSAVEAERVRVADRLAAAEPELARTAKQAAPTGTPTKAHLLFFAIPKVGYVLIRRRGPAPKIGEQVDISGHGGPPAANVAKLEQRLYEGTSLRCACLT